MKKIINFLDKTEDKIRGLLARHPMLYAIVGAIGVVLLWRGIWHTADEFSFLTGPVSIILGLGILLITGVFVSSFVENRIIMTGLRGEKKLADKTLAELNAEEEKMHAETSRIEETLKHIESEIKEIKSEIK